MFVLDNRTILIAQIIVGIIISIFCFMPQKNLNIKKLFGFKWGNISYVTGFFLLFFQKNIPAIFSVFIANSGILLSFILFSHVIANLFDIKINKKYSYIVLTINSLLFLIFLYIIPNTFIRIIVISINIVIILAHSIFTFVRTNNKHKSFIWYFVLITQMYYILMIVLRIILTISLNFNIISIFNSNIATSIIFLSSIAYHISVNFIIFIRLLNLNEEILYKKIELIKGTHSDIKELNSFIRTKGFLSLDVQLYNKIISFISKRFNVTSIIIYKTFFEQNKLKMVSHFNISEDLLEQLKEIPISEQHLSGRSILSNKPHFLETKDYPESEIKKILIKEGYQDLISFPISSYKGTFGAFTLGFKNSESIIKEDSEFFSLICNQIGTILENASLYEELDNLATTDPLTGIFNRRNFNDLFIRSFDRFHRTKNHLSLISIDIDHFKEINDTYGHDVGDKTLTKVVNIIKKSLRSTDIFARFGGEEFMILLEDSDLNTTIKTAERIRKSIMEKDIDIGKEAIKVTISLGLTQIQQTDLDFKEIAHRVDVALYSSKKKGRNRTEFI